MNRYHYIDIDPERVLAFVISNEGISSIDLAVKLDLISPGKPTSGLSRLRAIKKLLGDRIFLQRDKKKWRWFSGEHAKNNHILTKVTPRSTTYSGRLDDLESKATIVLVDFINKHFITPDSMKGAWLC